SNGKHFITNEEAEKWDKEHHDPKEARLPTLAEIEEEIEKIAERQEYEAQKEYTFKAHFWSIYEEKIGLILQEHIPQK
ncbi:7744_t:CDS:2, partial [Funneliformis geosporum]